MPIKYYKVTTRGEVYFAADVNGIWYHPEENGTYVKSSFPSKSWIDDKNYQTDLVSEKTVLLHNNTLLNLEDKKLDK